MLGPVSHPRGMVGNVQLAPVAFNSSFGSHNRVPLPREGAPSDRVHRR